MFQTRLSLATAKLFEAKQEKSKRRNFKNRILKNFCKKFPKKPFYKDGGKTHFNVASLPKNFNYEKNGLLYPVQSERKYRKIGNEVPKTVFWCTGHLIEKFKIIVKKRDDGASCPVTTIPMITGKITVRE